MSRSAVVALVGALALIPAASAHAAFITLGSDLSASAATSINDTSRIEQHGADTAFWPLAFGNAGAIQTPVDGQIVSVKIKGTVFKERGAADPLNYFQVQALGPAAGDGSRKVYLTSGGELGTNDKWFYLPIDQPNAVTTYHPDNLCIPAGGTWDFNDKGGHEYGGSLDAPLDPKHYIGGARFGIFGTVSGSSTAQYTAADQTNNGFTLYPSTTNQDINDPYGNVRRDEELLMQVVIATGDDIGVPCKNNLGIPWSPNSQTPATPPAPKVMIIHAQRVYVSHSHLVSPAAYCPEVPGGCTGTGSLLVKGKPVASAKFAGPPHKTLHVPMKLSAAAYKVLRRAKSGKATFVVTSALGTVRRVIKLQA